MVEQETNSKCDGRIKGGKKKRYRRLYWLSAELVLLVVVLFLLLHKPGSYNPAEPINDNQVSTYLTHELLADFYNNVQLDEPFDLIVEQAGITDIIARSKWPRESDGVVFGTPAVVFERGRIIVMGVITLKGIDFIITAVLAPRLDEGNLLHLDVDALKVGAMNVTFIAKVLARRMYERRAAGFDGQDWRAKAAAALLGNKPIDPILDVEDKKIRIKKVHIVAGRLIIGFVPAK